MADPLHLIAGTLRDAFAAVTSLPAADIDPVVRPSDRADAQANGALALAKALGRNPRELAQAVADTGMLAASCSAVEVAGPGFINLTFTPEFLSAALLEASASDRLAVRLADSPETAVVDYSAPNVAKEMHVGHLRTTVIGDSLVRLLEFVGHRVIRENHIGDWGTPFGMLIEHLTDLGEEEAVSSLSIGDLDAFYRAARAKFDADDAFKERSRLRVVALQSGDPETRRLWTILVDHSVVYFSEVYATLDVTLTPDDAVGESYYNEMLGDVVTDLRSAGLAVDSDGAWCVFPEGFTNREGEPLPLIVQKRDEGFGYAATDLAAVRDRVGHLRADDILYVVGTPQAQHFAMIFAVARAAGWLPDSVRAEHVGFGNVLGPDRKMFKTRAGGTVKLIGLLDEAVERAEAALRDRSDALSDDERRALAGEIARAAIKYADLSQNRTTDYVFSFDKMLQLTGNTAAYMQYAVARVEGIFGRAGIDREQLRATTTSVRLADPRERVLALELARFAEALEDVEADYRPNLLTAYLYDLAGCYSSFYDALPVLKAEGEDRASRLALCDLTGRILRQGLSLLGIGTVEKM